MSPTCLFCHWVAVIFGSATPTRLIFFVKDPQIARQNSQVVYQLEPF